jgi:hypothetical protein
MKPNTVVIGLYDPEDKPKANDVGGYSKKTTELIKQNLETFSQIRDSEKPNMSLVEYIDVLKDIQDAKKHLVVARQYPTLVLTF